MASYSPGRRTLLMALPAIALAMKAEAAPQAAPAIESGADESLDAWIDAYGRPTASVMVNGQGPFRFMVDTGSNTTVIAMRHALALGTPMLGMAMVNGTTGSAELPVARVADLRTGAVHKSNLRVAVLADASLPHGDGILGADVFAGRKLSFDITRRTVLVERSNTARKLLGAGNITVRNGLLAEVEGKVGRVNTRMMLDTGAQRCIANDALTAELGQRYPRMLRVERASVTGVTGHAMTGDFLRLPDVALGNVIVKDAGAVAAQAPIFELWGMVDRPAMIVGVDVLSRLSSFSIDYGARQFRATPMAMLVAQEGVRLG